MVLEQRRSGEDVDALVGVAVARARPGQELAARLRHRRRGERGVHHAVGEDAPGGVEIPSQAGEAEDRPVHARLQEHDAAGAGHGATGRCVGELGGPVLGGLEEQRFDPRRARGDLAGPAQQVQPHGHDGARAVDPLDDPQPGHLVGGCERVGVRAAPRRAAGTGPEQRDGGGAEDRRPARAHGVVFLAPARSQAASASTTVGAPSTPITRGRPATYARANCRKLSKV